MNMAAFPTSPAQGVSEERAAVRSPQMTEFDCVFTCDVIVDDRTRVQQAVARRDDSRLAARSKRNEQPPLQVSEEALGARCSAWVRRVSFSSLKLKMVILMSVEELELLH